MQSRNANAANIAAMVMLDDATHMVYEVFSPVFGASRRKG